MTSRAGIDYSNYIKSENQCNRIDRNVKYIYEKLQTRKSKGNQILFLKYVNEKLKSKVGITPLRIDIDITITDEDKANTLNKCFASVFTRENLDNAPKVEPS